jgi:hypothetical protein
MGNEFWAVILGAVVAGMIAFVLQRINLNDAKRQRDEERDERRYAVALSLLFKMVKIHSNMVNLHQHVQEKLTEAEGGNKKRELWQDYLPVANLPRAIHFSIDEMALLLSLKDDDLFNDLASIDEIHNSAVELFKKINSRRELLLAELPAKMEGNRGTMLLTPEQMPYFRPKMVEINLLIQSAAEWCAEQTPKCRGLLERLHRVLKSKVGITNQLFFKTDM